MTMLAETRRRRLVLSMAAFTTLVEALSVAGLLPSVRVGRLDLSLAILPALGLAVACGDRLVGRSSLRRVAAWYWIVASLVLAGLLVAYIAQGDASLYLSLVVAALGEELVYRVAVPATVAVILVTTGLVENRARIWGLVVAGMWFMALPGHREQITSVGAFLSLLFFTLLASILVYRSGSLLPMALGHAVANLTTVLMWQEALPPDFRGVLLASVLALLALAYGRPRRFTLDDERGLIDIQTGLPVIAARPHGASHDHGHGASPGPGPGPGPGGPVEGLGVDGLPPPGTASP